MRRSGGCHLRISAFLQTLSILLAAEGDDSVDVGGTGPPPASRRSTQEVPLPVPAGDRPMEI
jgi:hypothetical protein